MSQFNPFIITSELSNKLVEFLFRKSRLLKQMYNVFILESTDYALRSRAKVLVSQVYSAVEIAISKFLPVRTEGLKAKTGRGSVTRKNSLLASTTRK